MNRPSAPTIVAVPDALRRALVSACAGACAAHVARRAKSRSEWALVADDLLRQPGGRAAGQAAAHLAAGNAAAAVAVLGLSL